MQKHTIYVPDQFAVSAREWAVLMAGGATLSPGHQGYWRSSDGKLYVDDITLVTVFEEGTEARDRITLMLFNNDEQTVAYETNGTPFLIAAPRLED